MKIIKDKNSQRSGVDVKFVVFTNRSKNEYPKNGKRENKITFLAILLLYDNDKNLANNKYSVIV